MVDKKIEPIDPMALAGNVARRVEIQNVGLLNLQIAREAAISDEPSLVEYAVDTKSEHFQEEKTISVFVRLRLNAKSPKSEASSINAVIEFNISYSVNGDAPITKDELSSFGRLNGVYNAWPYIREIVQNLFVRMALPPLVLPVMSPGKILGLTQPIAAANERPAKKKKQ